MIVTACLSLMEKNFQSVRGSECRLIFGLLLADGCGFFLNLYGLA